MSYDYRVSNSGIVLAEQGMDGAAIERALKQRDPDLSLQGWPSQTHNCILWKVVRYAGPDRPPDTVCIWQSDRGEPYPLSSGLLDKVDRLDKNSRSVYVSDDELNQRKRERETKGKQDAYDDLAHDWDSKHGRPMLPRSQSLRMARDKQRARGKKI